MDKRQWAPTEIQEIPFKHICITVRVTVPKGSFASTCCASSKLATLRSILTRCLAKGLRSGQGTDDSSLPSTHKNLSKTETLRNWKEFTKKTIKIIRGLEHITYKANETWQRLKGGPNCRLTLPNGVGYGKASQILPRSAQREYKKQRSQVATRENLTKSNKTIFHHQRGHTEKRNPSLRSSEASAKCIHCGNFSPLAKLGSNGKRLPNSGHRHSLVGWHFVTLFHSNSSLQPSAAKQHTEAAN
ncbi:hypothetical protein QYF61_013035 [Mycteria americana]|uniref:Uncharacterized protein n=1 Tax=Mycteria americana TaxID=33587 RepID=A0AAN7NZB7_MYCAM|nr:hypothetical protein QYF61_013035 [Mycteria americana]